MKLSLSGTARESAVQIMINVHQSDSSSIRPTAQELLQSALMSYRDPREAGLCTELVFGALRREIRLEWLVNRHLLKPHKLPLAMRMILLVAAYELLFLDRIPSHATVNWAVSAVKKSCGAQLSRVANAVLRKIAVLGPEVHELSWYRGRIDDEMMCLSIFYALPLWILQLWKDAYGLEQTLLFAEASIATPWPALRVNRRRPEWETCIKTALAHGAISFGASGLSFPPGTVSQEIRQWVASGLASWQGSGSQIILNKLSAPQWDDPIWDACAGRGGKTCALLEMGKNVALSSDPSNRILALREEVKRLDLPDVTIRQAAAETINLDCMPRTIMLDIPCSGLGTLARHPDIRLFRKPEDMDSLISLQTVIIDKAWSVLNNGGCLAYITCTLNPAENERQVQRLLSLHPNAVLEQECSIQGEYGGDSMYGALIRKNV